MYPEIFKLAQRVAVIEKGRVIRLGRPEDVFFPSQCKQACSCTGRILSILKIDVIHIALVAVGDNICKVILTSSMTESLKVVLKLCFLRICLNLLDHGAHFSIMCGP